MRYFFGLLGLLFFANVTIAEAACDLSLTQKIQIELLGGVPLNAASTSMYPTLPFGAVFLAKVFGADGPRPVRGDIVALCLQKNPGTIYIKRIIGLPGDRVEMIDNQVVLNGEKLPRTPSGTGTLENVHDFPCFEERMGERTYRICQIGPGLTPLSNLKEMTVPAGELFVLGDNRDNSADSRLPDWAGSVRIENLIGVVKSGQ